MVFAKEIYDYINSFAPFDTAMSFDNVGLLIGNSEQSTDLVLLALDVTPDVISEAVQKGAKIIVSHHPIIFNPLKSIQTDSVPYLAIQNRLTVISAHTNLDIAPDGVNDTLAQAIGVHFTEHTNEDCMLTGELAEETDTKNFALKIKSVLGCHGLRYTERNGKFKRVAVACGAGGDSIFAAEKAGAQAFVTGEIKHHEILFALEKNISIFDLGHFCSEDLIITKLTSILSEKFPDAKFEKAKSDTDKVKYL